MKNMPESLMQSCIKVSNEAPADLRSNLTRSWAYFSQETLDASSKPTEFKACLMTLCFYHAIVLGRRRFGQQGWSKRYSFNQGDLTVCADVLMKVRFWSPVLLEGIMWQSDVVPLYRACL
jgi:dynein heavy chain, axonemal